jgi:hypothetical protein
VSALDCSDAAALTAALEAVPLGHWAEVVTGRDRHLVQRVPGGWHLPGDLAVTSADVADGMPTHVAVLGDDGRLPAEAVGPITREMDDLDSVGWSEPIASATKSRRGSTTNGRCDRQQGKPAD